MFPLMCTETSNLCFQSGVLYEVLRKGMGHNQ